MFTDIHHAGYFVQDLNEAVAMYERVFGGRCVKRGSAAAGPNAFVMVGETYIELIEPVDKSRIPGHMAQMLEHIGYLVPDIRQAMADLKARGVRLASEEPITNIMGWKLMFLDTADTMGTRIHLTEV